MKSKKTAKYFTISVITILCLIAVSAYTKKIHYKLSRFIGPETCGGCHEKIYDQWKNSMHHLAHKDPIYNEVSLFLLKGLTDKNEIKEAESCVKCHTPIGFVSGYPKKRSDNIASVPEIAREGIQCDYCHSATGAKKMYNNDIRLSPGHGDDNPGIKRGPFKDSEADYHKSRFSEFHTSSRICGTCHNVRHVVFGTKLETTYEEWEKGPYNSKNPNKRITCQGCHMYQKPGTPGTGSTKRPKNPGTAAIGSKKRDHIFTHYFIGGNTLVPEKFNDTLKSKMAKERLTNAAELSIDSSEIKSGKLIVNVKNTGAGHYLPTGLTDTRQMWLEITVKNKKNKIIYSSGKLDKNNYIPEGAIIYNTVFGDGKGNKIINIAKAREILKDRRIPPLKSLKETIKLPVKKSKSITVEVKLLYRIAPQRIVDAVLGKGKLILPVVTMEKIKKKI